MESACARDAGHVALLFVTDLVTVQLKAALRSGIGLKRNAQKLSTNSGRLSLLIAIR